MTDLLQAATQARALAYAPYSGCKVGAAVKMDETHIFTGSNVENSSFGATVCAERVAIQKAVSEGAKKITEILVYTDATPPWPPCGICRQVMAEFSDPNTKIHLANLTGIVSTHLFSELLPHAFQPAHLK